MNIAEMKNRAEKTKFTSPIPYFEVTVNKPACRELIAEYNLLGKARISGVEAYLYLNHFQPLWLDGIFIRVVE